MTVAAPKEESPQEQQQQYDPNRTIYLKELEKSMDLLVNPVWIFDHHKRMTRWGNKAALELWNSPCLEELVARDFSQMSPAVVKRNEELLWTFEQGRLVRDQWTFYPKGQPKTCRITIGGIRLLDDLPKQPQEEEETSSSVEDDSSDSDSDTLPPICFLVEGVLVDQLNSKVDNEMLRGVEMLRHLPIAVCQFDMEGKCMFQNPEACLPAQQQLTTANASQDEEDQKEDHAEGADDKDKPQSSQHGGLQKKRAATTASDDQQQDLEEEEAGTDTTAATTTSTDSSEDSNGSSGSGGSGSGSNDNNNKTKKKKTKRLKKTKSTITTDQACSLAQRFVDPTIGPSILQQLDDLTKGNGDNNKDNSPPPTPLDFEAMIYTSPKQKNEGTSHQTTTNTCWAAIQIRHAKDPVTGQPVLLYSARDRTDAMEARRQKQEKEEKAEFLAIITHEVRTPLHQIIGYVDLLDQTCLEAEQQLFVSILKTATQGLMTVINDVLDFSKLEAGKLRLENIPYEPLSVVKGSMEAVRACCEEANLHLQLKYDPTIPFRLVNDPNRLRQILLNLLSNAVKFTKNGGTITVRAKYIAATTTTTAAISPPEEEEDKQNETHNNNDNRNNPLEKALESPPRQQQQGAEAGAAARASAQAVVRFVVEDTGIGISQNHLDIIFQKYSQANTSVARTHGGTGLGLSICHLLTQMMGGSMGVSSTVGVGTAFWFELPAITPPEEVEKSESTTLPTQTTTARKGSSSTFTTAASVTSSSDTSSGGCSEEEEDDDNNNNSACADSNTNTGNNQTLHHHHHDNNPTTTARTTTATPSCCPQDEQQQQQPPESSTTKPVRDQQNSLNVLVVEDNKINSKLVEKMLGRMGHTSSVAENGKEAIDMITSQKNVPNNSSGNSSSGSSGGYDIVLMDIQMPVMDGLEATRRLRSMGYSNLPIFGLTASVGRSDYVELGFDDWLPKPIRMKDLKHRLYQLQQQQQQQQQRECQDNTPSPLLNPIQSAWA